MNAFARTRDKARTLLNNSALMAKDGAREHIETLLSSLKYNDGYLAHFSYGNLENVLNKPEFTQLLSILGTNEEKFNEFKEKFCYFVEGAYKCMPANVQYCDPNHCEGS